MDESIEAGAQTADVFRLIYRSHDLIPVASRRKEHGTLFTIARANNKRADITGALLVFDDWFVQTLEGEEDKVRSLFARIKADPRHDSVELLDTEGSVERIFPRWWMAAVSADHTEPDTYLIAHTDGIAAAAARGTTAAQDAVLGTMRAAARGTASVG